MTTPSRNDGTLVLPRRSASPLRPRREQRITNVCRKSHFIQHDRSKEEQIRRRRESPLRSSIIIIISGISAIVIINKSTRPAREVQKKKGLCNLYEHYSKPNISSQSGTATISIPERIGSPNELEDWRGPVVWLPPSSPSHERFSSFAGSAPNPPRLALAFCFSVQESGSGMPLNAAPNGFIWALLDAGHVQGRYSRYGRFRIDSRHSASSLHQWLHSVQSATITPAFYFWRPMLLQLEHGSPPEAMLDRRLHAAVPPVFHVALLAHHTADVLPASAMDAYEWYHQNAHLNLAFLAGLSASLWPR